MLQILICISKRVYVLIFLVSFHYSTSQSTKYSDAATNSAFFLFNLGKYLKMNIYRGLYEYLIIYFWSKPSFRSSKKLRDMFPASAWGETVCMWLLFWGGNSAVSTLSLCGETRRMRSHTSPRWNRHWQDALFVRCNGVIGGPKELRQSQKRWCVGGVCRGWPLLS